MKRYFKIGLITSIISSFGLITLLSTSCNKTDSHDKTTKLKNLLDLAYEKAENPKGCSGDLYAELKANINNFQDLFLYYTAVHTLCTPEFNFYYHWLEGDVSVSYIEKVNTLQLYEQNDQYTIEGIYTASLKITILKDIVNPEQDETSIYEIKKGAVIEILFDHNMPLYIQYFEWSANEPVVCEIAGIDGILILALATSSNLYFKLHSSDSNYALAPHIYGVYRQYQNLDSFAMLLPSFDGYYTNTAA